MVNYWKPTANPSEPFESSDHQVEWKEDIKKWLIECKKIPDPTSQEINELSKQLYDSKIESEYDLTRDDFCRHTGWRYGKPEEPKPLEEIYLND